MFAPSFASPSRVRAVNTPSPSPLLQKKSQRNKNNREKQVTKYTCGPLSFEEINFATVSSKTENKFGD
ncbi:hypothetical protein K1719_009460 [Acacia pycnantha]|nr:hypothetical protein K1719_009460 [Acacia pycnantha]